MARLTPVCPRCAEDRLVTQDERSNYCDVCGFDWPRLDRAEHAHPACGMSPVCEKPSVHGSERTLPPGSTPSIHVNHTAFTQGTNGHERAPNGAMNPVAPVARC